MTGDVIFLQAMNRSLSNVILGGYGTNGGGKAARKVRGAKPKAGRVWPAADIPGRLVTPSEAVFLFCVH